MAQYDLKRLLQTHSLENAIKEGPLKHGFGTVSGYAQDPVDKHWGKYNPSRDLVGTDVRKSPKAKADFLNAVCQALTEAMEHTPISPKKMADVINRLGITEENGFSKGDARQANPRTHLVISS